MPSVHPVDVRRETIRLPTYEPHWPDRNPMFLEKRVYQGSSGRVYPLPFTDRIAEKPVLREWDAVTIENEFLRILILPELGGRIHRAQDKTNGYDFIYHQPVIKPALVGLAGPWASGGIEFNWPQHHRPSTFMPAEVAIESHADGSATVWLSEHDPMARMKGMHGVRLHPGKSYLELVARIYNRTPDVQTFLWWANVATRVHARYQSFFPPDVTYIADHAKRATSTFPHAQGPYYGVDYAARKRHGVPAAEAPRLFPPDRADSTPDDLSWYANIPVPTSYMAMGSREDFAGGYDHQAQAGLVHIANHYISPGKKQWTWGNHEFGYAWDRNLTDPDARGEFAPYIELMSGVFTDNQPDFSFLQPGETKTWSQFWYPLRAIGPAQKANVDAAVSLRLAHGEVHLGVAATAVHAQALIRLETRGRTLGEWTSTLAPARPFTIKLPVRRGLTLTALTLRVLTRDGHELIVHSPEKIVATPPPPAATEPPSPASVKSNDELFLTGQHLEQYRHATRAPETYWREALRRDPGDARCHLALGRWHLRRGEFSPAETHLRASIARLTSRNPNPADGEAHYQLGRTLAFQSLGESKIEIRKSKIDESYAAFYKATWNHAWQAAGFHALAEIDALRGDWSTALDHLDRALRVNTDNLRARNLKVVALRQLQRPGEATLCLAETLALDPLDAWARHLSGRPLHCDQQIKLDLALDFARAGLLRDALKLLATPATPPRFVSHSAAPRLPDASLGTEPLLHYYRAWLAHRLDDRRATRTHLRAAARATADFCFPARLEEIVILQHAIAANPRDARAPFYLGHLLYDRRRHSEAIALWERAVRLEPGNAVAWRNLGIASFNISRRPAAARRAYDRACAAASRPGKSPLERGARRAGCVADARLLYERDQLWKRLREKPAVRLRVLLQHIDLVRTRDDLTVELCALLNQTGAPDRARPILAARKFQPWEGGEGLALGQHVRTHLILGRRAFSAKKYSDAIRSFSDARSAPENLGEAKHLLANQSDIHLWLGRAYSAAGDPARANSHWTLAAEARGDFQAMSVRAFSEMTYFSALALAHLGQKARSRRLLLDLLAHAQSLADTPAVIDYFATSLPTLLLFDDDLTARQKTTALLLEAQARLGLGQTARARALFTIVLRRDPAHPTAADLLRSD